MDEVETISTIADGLTRAQRARLDGIAELNARGLEWSSVFGSLRISTSRTTTKALLGLGLINNDSGYARLTPLGLQVRAHLEGQTDAG